MAELGDTAGSSTQSEAQTLASIEQFLETEPAGVEPMPGITEYSYELPAVEHFVDGPAEDSLMTAAESTQTSDEYFPDVAEAQSAETEWGEAEWQQFDWRSAASLGEAGDPAASDAWLDTDWDKSPMPPAAKRESAAKAIADALDGIARRIREGELAIPSPGSGATPADIAATLAKLLGGNR
jgi:hypothetical protein